MYYINHFFPPTTHLFYNMLLLQHLKPFLLCRMWSCLVSSGQGAFELVNLLYIPPLYRYNHSLLQPTATTASQALSCFAKYIRISYTLTSVPRLYTCQIPRPNTENHSQGPSQYYIPHSTRRLRSNGNQTLQNTAQITFHTGFLIQ